MNNDNIFSFLLQKGISILEALSATGLRSVRYAKEVPFVREIVANDISAAAVESIKKNVEHNGVEGIVRTSHDDATCVRLLLILYYHFDTNNELGIQDRL